MMLAPSSGGELRDHIKDYVQNLKDEVARAREAKRVELEHELLQLRRPSA
jgi:gas vesicle protein